MIHSERNYNRYCFHGKYRINRDEIEREHPRLVEIFDYILFKEKTHLKRGIGFTTVPEKLLYHRKTNGLHLKQEIKQLFLTFFGSESKQTENIENIENIKNIEK